MPIILSEYDKLVECKGNKHNKIFIVQNRESGEKAILKIIDLHEPESQLREIEVHKHLDHKYVIKLMDYEMREGKLLMLIELAKYGDLYGLLARIDELGKDKILKLFYRILKAVDYLHANNIVHRDIKPENILLTARFKPKLADFGTSASQNVIANTFCGTYEYMAPEVYLRCKQTDKVDVWAVGVLLYELFHKRTPFKNDTLKTIKEKVEGRTIEFKPNVDPKLIDFVYYALQFDPRNRPSVKELLMHDIFDSIRPRIGRTTTMKTVHKPAVISLQEFEHMRTQSRHKRDPNSPASGVKTPVQGETFGAEHSTKNFENTVRKMKICEYLANLKAAKDVKDSREPKREKRVVPSLSNRSNKLAHSKSSLFNDKSGSAAGNGKAAHGGDTPVKPDVYDFFSLKKKGLMKASSNINRSNLSSASNRLLKAPSTDKTWASHKKAGSQQSIARGNFNGTLHNLYEKRDVGIVRIRSVILK